MGSLEVEKGDLVGFGFRRKKLVRGSWQRQIESKDSCRRGTLGSSWELVSLLDFGSFFPLK